MKPLPAEFDFDNSHFRQLARNGDVVLVARTGLLHRRPTFEVFLVQRHPACMIHGRAYPERESMPATASWGTSGWSYATCSEASRKFDELVKLRENPNPSPTPFPAHASKPH